MAVKGCQEEALWENQQIKSILFKFYLISLVHRNSLSQVDQHVEVGKNTYFTNI